MAVEMTLAEQIAAAKASKNHSEAKVGGDYTIELPPAGTVYARFIEYIELGKHPAEYQGKPKPPAQRVRFVFELLTPVVKMIDGKRETFPNVKEIEVEGGKKKIANTISFTLTESQSDKSGFYKLFKHMAYGREQITHFAEMLGEAFKVEVVHNTTGTGAEAKTYANIQTKDRGWLVNGPFTEQTDSETLETTRIDMSSKVPANIAPIRLFQFDIPTKSTWDALFIDGTRKEKKGDVEVEVSKNWIQEMILSAVNYGGSALEQMIGKVDNLPGMDNTAPEKNGVGKSSAIPEEKAPVGEKTTVADADAALREMGLLD